MNNFFEENLPQQDNGIDNMGINGNLIKLLTDTIIKVIIAGKMSYELSVKEGLGKRDAL